MGAEPNNWDDEARLILRPKQSNEPHYHADLASCVRRAIEVAESQSRPDSIEIEHADRFLDLDEIRMLAASPSFPQDTTGNVATDALKPS